MTDAIMREFARAFCDALASHDPNLIAPWLADVIDWTIYGPVDLFPFFGQRRGKAAVVTLIELPLVLPPAVAGIGLLAAFGRLGLLGSSLDAFGISLPFTQSAVTVAVAYVASPLYIRQAIAAFEATDPNLAAASRTLGASPVRTFFRVILPLARGGLIAGLALSFARGLGEFGATIMFAGSLQGVTQTVPLAIYAQFDQDFEATLAMSAVLVLFSVALLATLHAGLSWQRSESTSSQSLFGLSGSS